MVFSVTEADFFSAFAANFGAGAQRTLRWAPAAENTGAPRLGRQIVYSGRGEACHRCSAGHLSLGRHFRLEGVVA